MAIISGSSLAPVPEIMTSYCFRPRGPDQLDISSAMTSCGLYPSAFFSLKAIFLIVVLFCLIYRSVFRFFVLEANAGVMSFVNSKAEYTRSDWSSFGAMQ